MIKYKDKVRIIKDDDGGFYIGTEGVVMERRKNASVASLLSLDRGNIFYGVWTGERTLYCTEDYLENID